ncbi:MAG: ABC transporter ATP-binding protein [Halanaerobiales bacterium]|nr:ABC transporter ATP-binding protein [Halanaerobiales bacterium]
MPNNDQKNLLDVKNLKTHFFLNNGQILRAVDGISFSLKKGECLGIVGESGSGKSVTSRSILNCVESPGKIVDGEILYEGRNLLTMSEKELRKIRGSDISLIFQNPTTALDPLQKIGDQFFETLKAHSSYNNTVIKEKVLETIKSLGFEKPEVIYESYPCDFSPGYIQRIMIALAILCKPKIVIADEPTTTLGVTIQSQILSMLDRLRTELGTSIIMITHDFGVIAQVSTKVMVMYGGQCMEYGPKKDLFLEPKHPYTIGLIRSVPLIEARTIKKLYTIPGSPPEMINLPSGCVFASRCEYVGKKCLTEKPPLKKLNEERYCSCHYPVEFNTRDEIII